ncbi:MAG: EAL domain-containing protein [Deltaproteobacteria bacterium]|nr:EAL domain-containing protein [Deltaproteobacteria bacterium]
MATSRRGLTRDLLPHVSTSVGISDLRIVYQPILDLQRLEVFGYEALARSTDPSFRGPFELFRDAIERNCCGELGRSLRELAIEGCPYMPLFLNIHPQEFDDGWLVRPDDPVFRHEPAVYLEITESVPLSHHAYCKNTLQEVRSKGIRLAVDDLGAGYSNLRYIADLEPEVVKLDRELVADLPENPRLFSLVRSVVGLCVQLGATVVAEGIERESEFDAAREAGAHFGQGFYIARPANPPPTPARVIVADR